VFGMYRRHMKTIGCLGQIDKLYDDTELEHHSCDRADLEGPDEDAINDVRLPSIPSMSAMAMLHQLSNHQ